MQKAPMGEDEQVLLPNANSAVSCGREHYATFGDYSATS